MQLYLVLYGTQAAMQCTDNTLGKLLPIGFDYCAVKPYTLGFVTTVLSAETKQQLLGCRGDL